MGDRGGEDGAEVVVRNDVVLLVVVSEKGGWFLRRGVPEKEKNVD